MKYRSRQYFVLALVCAAVSSGQITATPASRVTI
jgi:hypothetical protein